MGLETFEARHPPWIKYIEHTADVGIVVRAPDLKTLYERAAWGMFSIITEVSRVAAAETVGIRIEGADAEGLMVAWLSELNFLHGAARKVFCRFTVRELDRTSLKADAFGEELDPGKHVIRSEIKGVTFHELGVRKRGKRWYARVIFDL